MKQRFLLLLVASTLVFGGVFCCAHAATTQMNQTLSPSNELALSASLNSLQSFFELLRDAIGQVASATAPDPSPDPAPDPAPTLAIVSVPVTNLIALATPTVTTTTPLPYVVNGFSDMAGWEQTWGDVSIASGSLEIAANASTTGGEAELASSSGWTDYLFTISLDWVKGETFSLIARSQPNQNNVSCEFLNGGQVYIYETINDARTLLGMGTVAGFTSTGPVTASIQVKGDRVQCSLDGSVIEDYLYRGLPAILMSGGIDVETWDPQVNNAEILLQKVSVVALP